MQQLAVVKLSIGHLSVPPSKDSISEPERSFSVLRGDWHSQCLVIILPCAALFKEKVCIQVSKST